MTDSRIDTIARNKRDLITIKLVAQNGFSIATFMPSDLYKSGSTSEELAEACRSYN